MSKMTKIKAVMVRSLAIILSLVIFTGSWVYAPDNINSVRVSAAAEQPKQEEIIELTPIAIPMGLGDSYSFCVIDARTGEVLMGENEDDIIYPASITKLMTAMIVLENSKLSRVVNVTKDMFDYVASDVFVYGIKPGQSYTVETLLNMAMVNSSGDAAVIMALDTFGSMKKFVKAMNSKVKALGLTSTHFENPIGLDVGNDYYEHYSTARETALITRYAMSSKKLRSIVIQKNYQVVQADGTMGNEITSSNRFFTDKVAYSTDLYEIIGSKTGSTYAAGHVFAATAKDKAGHEIICAYMGKGAMDRTFKDIELVLRNVFTSLKDGSAKASTGKCVVEVPEKSIEVPETFGLKFSLGAEVKDSVTGAVLNDIIAGKLKYSSSDPSVAYVDARGIVTVKKAGKAVITITSPTNTYYKKAVSKVKITVG